MRAFTIAAVIAAATTVATERLAANESFDEILILRPLPDGKVLAHFAFNVSIDHPHDTPRKPSLTLIDSNSNSNSNSSSSCAHCWCLRGLPVMLTVNSRLAMVVRHYRLFPRQIGEVIQRYHIRELNVAFTQGTWRIEDWGYPPVNDASHGAQVLARIGDEERQATAYHFGPSQRCFPQLR
ncbi:Subunit of the glycosylphosphatidylinositol transamidase complex-like protein, partial [Spiromyces aspiralis]